MSWWSDYFGNGKKKSEVTRKEFNALEERVTKIMALIDDIKAQVVQLTDANAAAQASITSLSGSIVNIAGDIDRLDDKIIELQKLIDGGGGLQEVKDLITPLVDASAALTTSSAAAADAAKTQADRTPEP